MYEGKELELVNHIFKIIDEYKKNTKTQYYKELSPRQKQIINTIDNKLLDTSDSPNKGKFKVGNNELGTQLLWGYTKMILFNFKPLNAEGVNDLYNKTDAEFISINDTCTTNNKICNDEYYFVLVYLLRFLFSIHCVNFKRYLEGNSLAYEIIGYATDNERILQTNGLNRIEIDSIKPLIESFYNEENVNISETIYNKYRDTIMNINYYADTYTIETLSRLLNLNIVIISKNYKSKKIQSNIINGYYDNKMTIFVFKRGEHYELLTYNEKSLLNNFEYNTIIQNLQAIGKKI